MKSLEYSKENKEEVNFLSRIFGVFSEEIVKIWCANDLINEGYKYIGKPHIKIKDKKRPLELDHLLYSEIKNEYYLVEQKSFHGYKNGKLASMEDTDIFLKSFKTWSRGKSKNQKSKAWDIFINFVEHPMEVNCNGNSYHDIKTLLIWSKGTPEGKRKFIDNSGIGVSEVLFLIDLKNALIQCEDQQYKALIDKKKKWIDELFIDLLDT